MNDIQKTIEKIKKGNEGQVWVKGEGYLFLPTAHLQEIVNRLEQTERRHFYWAAGEPDCPREIKAANGELHTLRCKVCGMDSPKNGCAGKENKTK